jgi:hypothetical protein
VGKRWIAREALASKAAHCNTFEESGRRRSLASGNQKFRIHYHHIRGRARPLATAGPFTSGR